MQPQRVEGEERRDAEQVARGRPHGLLVAAVQALVVHGELEDDAAHLVLLAAREAAQVLGADGLSVVTAADDDDLLGCQQQATTQNQPGAATY